MYANIRKKNDSSKSPSYFFSVILARQEKYPYLCTCFRLRLEHKDCLMV